MMGYGLGMGLFGWVWMLLFWGGLMLLALWVIGLLFPSVKKQDNHQTLSSPDEILKTRYAQGEITKEQYEEMKHTLQHG